MYRHKPVDGVTTALELEVGTDDIDRRYDEREGKALINYGVSVGHVKVRMAVMNDPREWLPSGAAARDRASDEQIAEMARRFLSASFNVVLWRMAAACAAPPSPPS